MIDRSFHFWSIETIESIDTILMIEIEINRSRTGDRTATLTIGNQAEITFDNGIIKNKQIMNSKQKKQREKQNKKKLNKLNGKTNHSKGKKYIPQLNKKSPSRNNLHTFFFCFPFLVSFTLYWHFLLIDFKLIMHGCLCVSLFHLLILCFPYHLYFYVFQLSIMSIVVYFNFYCISLPVFFVYPIFFRPSSFSILFVFSSYICVISWSQTFLKCSSQSVQCEQRRIKHVFYSSI
jgi:hypothetical protein